MIFSLDRHNRLPLFWLKVLVIILIPSVDMSFFVHSNAASMFLSSSVRHDVLDLIKMCENLNKSVEA